MAPLRWPIRKAITGMTTLLTSYRNRLLCLDTDRFAANITRPAFQVGESPIYDLNFMGCASRITHRWFNYDDGRWYYTLFGFKHNYAEDEISRDYPTGHLACTANTLTRLDVILYYQQKMNLCGDSARDTRRMLYALGDQFWPNMKPWLMEHAPSA